MRRLRENKQEILTEDEASSGEDLSDRNLMWRVRTAVGIPQAKRSLLVDFLLVENVDAWDALGLRFLLVDFLLVAT
jgi:hypothetical protein